MPAADPDTLADDATREALRLLGALRREVIGSIGSAPEPLSGSLFGLLREIDGLIGTFQRELSGAMGRHVERAAAAGDESVLDDLRAARLEVPLAYMGVDAQMVRLVAEYSASQITNLSSQARARITRDVRLAALGGMSTTDLIDRIGRNLTGRGTVFGSLAVDAEAIARTEVSRAYSMSYASQSAEAATRYPGMRKRWLHSTQAVGATAHQGRTARPNHVRVANETAENPIPFDEDFNLGNEYAPYPHWPGLSAKNVVFCRCRMQIVAPEPQEVDD